MTKNNVLIVDLNNFARYPTLAIAYLIKPLRQAGFHVDLLSPLAFGVSPTTQRESQETWQEHVKRRVYFSTHPIMLKLHDTLRSLYSKRVSRPQDATIQAVAEHIANQSVDIIMLSAYLNHYPSVKAIAELVQQKGIPVLLGGPAFNNEKVVGEWIDLPGVTAIFGGEAELVIADLADAIINDKPLDQFVGLFTKENLATCTAAPPLRDMASLPIPDFSDFPWADYQHRIIPMMTGRGCNWNICTFCSDVTTANGRTFRSRPLDAVFEEIRVQSERCSSKDFIFLDMKMNSDVEMWRAIIANFQKIVPDGRWIATVHVNAKGENGLTFDDLKAAKQSGLTRMSFGLETGSKNLNRRMGKGTTIEKNSQFVLDAHNAGISLRTSMMLGYPGESAEDIWHSVAFLKKHRQHIDRIRMSRFKVIPDTRFDKLYRKRPKRFSGIKNFHWDYRYARAGYEYADASDREYRKAKRSLLQIVHEINKEPLRDDAVQFDGLM